MYYYCFSCSQARNMVIMQSLRVATHRPDYDLRRLYNDKK